MKKSHKHQLLEHPTHTGKKLLAGHTSYPVLTFMLLLLGVFIVGLYRTAVADQGAVAVSARVAGLPPTQPATITSPTSGASVNSFLLPVSGTCPTASIIDLYRNNLLNGSTLCTANGTFSMNADLFWGENILVTKIYNLGDTEGPESAVINVYLNNPLASSSSSRSSNGSLSSNSSGYNGSQSGNQAPLLIQTPTTYQGAEVGQDITWKFSVSGGVPPYAIAVDWGDGNSSVLSINQPGTFSVNHTYSQPGGYKGNYTIKIRASDSKANQAYMQVFALVNGVSSASPGVENNNTKPGYLTIGSTNSSSGPVSTNTLKVIGSLYGVTVLMTASFWLGQARGVAMLAKRIKPPKIRPHHS